MSRLSKSLNACDNLTSDTCKSFTNFIMFTKNKTNRLENNNADLLLANLKNKKKRNQSCNSIELNPSYIDQFKATSNDENHLLDHLRSSNLLKRKSYLLANHLINNQLYTDEDYVTDLNRTDDDMIDDLFSNLDKDNQVELESSNEYSIVSYRRKKKSNRFNTIKQNLIKSCSCTDLSETSESVMSQISCSSSNDFYYEKKRSVYLECLDTDKPRVVYSTPPALMKHFLKDNKQTKELNVVPLSSYSENKKPFNIRNEKSNRKLKTSTRKPASKASDMIKFKKVKHFQKPLVSTQSSNLKVENDSTNNVPESKLPTSNTASFGNSAEAQYVNWSAIQGEMHLDLIDSNQSDFNVSKWVEWRKNLNEYLISNGASFFPLPESSLEQAKRFQSNQPNSVRNNLKNGHDKKSYTLFGIPKAKLTVGYLSNNKKVSELILEKERQQSQIEKQARPRATVYLEKNLKIPGANVREKIKAFEGKASLADTTASQSQQTNASNSTFSTTITSSLISSANDSSKSKASSKLKDSDKKDEPIYYNNDNPFRLIHAKWNRKASRAKKRLFQNRTKNPEITSNVISMNPKSDDSTVNKPIAPSSTVPSSILRSSSLIRRTKISFSKFFKNDRYNYLSPLKHMFRLKKNQLGIQANLASKNNHEYVNEKFVGKIHKDSIEKVRKSNFIFSSSSEAPAKNSTIKKTDCQKPKNSKKTRKMSALKQRKNLNLKAKEQFVLSAIQNSKESKVLELPNPIYRSVKVTKQTNKPLFPPPLPPPLTPFLKNQRLIENKLFQTTKITKNAQKLNNDARLKM